MPPSWVFFLSWGPGWFGWGFDVGIVNFTLNLETGIYILGWLGSVSDQWRGDVESSSTAPSRTEPGVTRERICWALRPLTVFSLPARRMCARDGANRGAGWSTKPTGTGRLRQVGTGSANWGDGRLRGGVGHAGQAAMVYGPVHSLATNEGRAPAGGIDFASAFTAWRLDGTRLQARASSWATTNPVAPSHLPGRHTPVPRAGDFARFER